MNSARHSILILLLPALLIVPTLSINVNAQTPYFKKIYINRENGSLKFNTLLFGKDGFLWFGTSEGLYKFDGSDPLLLTLNEPDFDNTVTALYQDNQDTLWIGYKSGQIAYSTGKELHLIKPEEGLPKKTITAISKDIQGNLWIATAGEGLYFFSNDRIYNINSDDGLNDNYVYVLSAEKDGNMWAGTDEGIALCSSGSKKKIVKSFHKEDGLPDNIVRVIIHDQQGDLWIGMQEKGICKFLSAQNRFVAPDMFSNWDYGQVNSITFDRDEMWIGTENKGIIHYDAKLNPLPIPVIEYNSFRFLRVAATTMDREGNLWLISNSSVFQSLAGSILSINKLPSVNLKMIHTLLFDREGKLWFSPDQGLVSCKLNDTSASRITQFTITPEKELIDIVSLYEDNCNYIWVGTMGAGLFRINQKTGKSQHIAWEKGLNNASIMGIDGKGDNIWVATLGGAFQIKLPQDCSQDNIPVECIKLDNENLLGNFYLYDVFVDSKNRVWFGTDGKGVTCIDHGEYFNYNENVKLKSNVIFSITEDNFGNMWFGSMNGGLYKYDGNTFKNYNQLDGLRYTSISGIIADQKGHLVVVHQHGFDVLDIETESFVNYGSEAGISDINSDLNAITCDKNGRVWIGTDDQIISFLSNSNSYMKKPLAMITKTTLFSSELNQVVNRRLSYDQNYLSFDFTGIWFSNPDRVKYQYMLEGYNKDWVSTRDRKIIFPNLAPGKYRFIVRTSLNKNFRQFTEASYAFVIRPPFWKENWFLFMSALLFCGLIYYIIKIRTEQIRRYESLRNEKIEFQYETLKNQVNPHFLFNSFNTLISTIEDDKDKAIEYVETLSAFFRNIVSYKDHDLILLKDELELTCNYFFLQKKRFINFLTMEIEVTEEAKRKEIPPMAVQILIENAIKHNAISFESPLRINISLIGNKLEIKNNINTKRTVETSTKTGLQNIINRYKIMTSEEVEVINNDHDFIVRLPLL